MDVRFAGTQRAFWASQADIELPIQVFQVSVSDRGVKLVEAFKNQWARSSSSPAEEATIMAGQRKPEGMDEGRYQETISRPDRINR
jgi:hypothetical protein